MDIIKTDIKTQRLPGPLPSTVLLIRAGAIGDIVMASGLPVAMRAAWPDACLHWLVHPRYAGLLRSHPCLDGLLPLAPTARTLLPKQFLSGLRALRLGRYDLVVDAQGLLKSTLLAWLTGAPERVGLHSREGGNHFMSRVVSRPASGGMLGAEYQHLARSLGLDARHVRPAIHLARQDKIAATDYLQAAGLQGAYAVLCPFTTRAQKHWPIPSWQSLIVWLTQSLDLPVLVVGGGQDRSAARAMLQGCKHVHNATGATSLAVSAALLESAALVIGVDTGMTHLGVAFRRPTVALFGSTCPYTRVPYARVRVLYQALPCAPCRRHPTCGGAFTCLVELRPDQVKAAVMHVLDLRKPH